eukprot:GILK01009440.1.p1 GENE.GILK01009440.1~~GILK01009440.1.p1  ORF type:complete len:757 (-),score=133.89 GILK01009440.1:189-2459(-)
MVSQVGVSVSRRRASSLSNGVSHVCEVHCEPTRVEEEEDVEKTILGVRLNYSRTPLYKTRPNPTNKRFNKLQKTYILSCNRAGYVHPDPQILESLEHSCIDADIDVMTPADIKALMNAMSQMNELQQVRISFGHCDQSVKSLRRLKTYKSSSTDGPPQIDSATKSALIHCLATSLPKRRDVKSLEITGIPFIKSETRTLCRSALRLMTGSLMILILRDCNLGDHGFTFLCEALRRMRSVGELDVSGNHLTDSSGRRLVDLFRYDSSRRDMIRWAACLRDSPMVTKTSKGIRWSSIDPDKEWEVRKQGLYKVDVSRNRLADTFAEGLYSVLYHDTWVLSIDVRMNDITSAGADYIYKLLDANMTLVNIDLRNNPSIDIKQIIAIKSQLQRNIRLWEEYGQIDRIIVPLWLADSDMVSIAANHHPIHFESPPRPVLNEMLNQLRNELDRDSARARIQQQIQNKETMSRIRRVDGQFKPEQGDRQFTMKRVLNKWLDVSNGLDKSALNDRINISAISRKSVAPSDHAELGLESILFRVARPIHPRIGRSLRSKSAEPPSRKDSAWQFADDLDSESEQSVGEPQDEKAWLSDTDVDLIDELVSSFALKPTAAKAATAHTHTHIGKAKVDADVERDIDLRDHFLRSVTTQASKRQKRREDSRRELIQVHKQEIQDELTVLRSTDQSPIRSPKRLFERSSPAAAADDVSSRISRMGSLSSKKLVSGWSKSPSKTNLRKQESSTEKFNATSISRLKSLYSQRL